MFEFLKEFSIIDGLFIGLCFVVYKILYTDIYKFFIKLAEIFSSAVIAKSYATAAVSLEKKEKKTSESNSKTN